jgi:hypothetical protein
MSKWSVSSIAFFIGGLGVFPDLNFELNFDLIWLICLTVVVSINLLKENPRRFKDNYVLLKKTQKGKKVHLEIPPSACEVKRKKNESQ